MLSIEYPYYRANTCNWQVDLGRLRDLGVKAVSFYIPWSLHVDDSGGADFCGRIHPQSNLYVFLQYLEQFDLIPLLKVGPYVHAELKYGGIPRGYLQNTVFAGSRNRRIATQDMYLPDLTKEPFRSYWRNWFDILFNFLDQTGLRIKGARVQFGNEGTVGEFAKFLDDPNFCDELIIPGYKDLLNSVPNGVEASFNLPLPTAVVDSDEWAEWECRVGKVKYAFPDVLLGRTEWSGNPLLDINALKRVIRSSKIGVKDVAEANWGYTWASDRWGKASNGLGNFLIARALGASSYNVYSGFQTCHVPNRIRMEPAYIHESEGKPDDHEGWYPPAAPLREGSSCTSELIYDLLRVLELENSVSNYGDTNGKQRLGVSTERICEPLLISDGCIAFPLTIQGSDYNLVVNTTREFSSIPSITADLRNQIVPPESYRVLPSGSNDEQKL